MKRAICLILLVLIPYYIIRAQGWDEATYRKIEGTITVPSFPNKTYDITRYGAKGSIPNRNENTRKKTEKEKGITENENSKKNGERNAVPSAELVKRAKTNQASINKAIAECSKAGGGMVCIPKGIWHTGAIRLQSNVNLVIDEGAELHFVYEPSLYPLVKTRWEGLDIMNYSPCIYAYKAKNVAITGKGTIDGGGTNDTWWQWCGATKYGFNPGKTPQAQNMPYAGDTKKFNATDKDEKPLSNRNMLLWMADHNIPVNERIFGDGCGMRPQLVNFYECENILVEDVTLLRSPFWSLTPTLSKNITVRRCKIINNGPNGDGCNPESCENVLIEGCLFHTGDDCIAIKSGRNADGRRCGIPSKNIIIRRCTMEDGHGGVVIGSEISAGVQNVFAEDCEMDSPNLDRVLRIKTNICRGGITDGIYMRNVRVGQCREAVLRINLQYEPKEQSQRGFIPTVRNVYMENVTCRKSRYGVLLNGLDSISNICNIYLTDCQFEGITEEPVRRTGLSHNVTFDNTLMNGKSIASPISPYDTTDDLSAITTSQALRNCSPSTLKKMLEGTPYSVRMALSEMIRCPHPYYLDFTDVKKRPQGKWSYVMGIELESLLDVYLTYGYSAILDYIREYPEMMIAEDGSITGYKFEDYNLDNVRTGRFIHRVNQLFPSLETEGTTKATATLFLQLQQQPRTKEGVWWHKEIYHDQVWLDGIYMGLPFYTMYANQTMNKAMARQYYDDAVAQVRKTFKRTYDKKTGLWKHAWDEKHNMFWADKHTGQSQHTWSRAMGWFAMAMLEILDVLPQEYAPRREVLQMFRQTMDAVVRYQDASSNLWYDVMDVNDPRNYLEATASCMFTYCMLKGARKGYLNPRYAEIGSKAYQSIIKEFVQSDNADGTLSLTRCCSVSGLGPETSPRRDGSFDYYMSEPVRDNDAKGIGPFIWASIEYEKLHETTHGAEHRLYDFVVPRDGNFREAIEAANTRPDTTQRFRIFVMKGHHVIPTKGTTIGGDSVVYPDPRTYLVAPNTSIIGEERDSTVLVNITPPATWHNGFNAASPLEGIGNGDVLIMEKSCHHTYLQDITIKNAMDDKTGRNIALHDRGDLTIAHNICLWGYQDTYVSNNSHGRYYFKGGVIRGRTDYICGKGDVFFDHVTFQQCDKAGYIAAPSIPRKYGYVMQHCYIKQETPDATYYLGRPWGNATPTAIWQNTKVDASPITKDKKGYNAWADMGSKGWPARFAEYNTRLTSGEPLDLTGRRSSWTDKDGNTHPNNPILSREEAIVYTLQNVLDGWDPLTDTEQMTAANVKIEGDMLRWDTCPGALLYAVCKNGKVIDFTTENFYKIKGGTSSDKWTVRTANQMGGLN